MPVSDYTPTTADIGGGILRARTRDSYGNLIGDFTDDTTPNADGATASINLAVEELSGTIGADIPDDLLGRAKQMAVFLSAMNIEMSYFPEQAATDNSIYSLLMTRFNSSLTTFQEDMAEEEEEDSAEGEDGNTSPLFSSGGFPPPQGWGTVRW